MSRRQVHCITVGSSINNIKNVMCSQKSLCACCLNECSGSHLYLMYIDFNCKHLFVTCSPKFRTTSSCHCTK